MSSCTASRWESAARAFQRDLTEVTGGRLFAVESTEGIVRDLHENSRGISESLSDQLFARKASGRAAGIASTCACGIAAPL